LVDSYVSLHFGHAFQEFCHLFHFCGMAL
jgi:hypothetical protein